MQAVLLPTMYQWLHNCIDESILFQSSNFWCDFPTVSASCDKMNKLGFWGFWVSMTMVGMTFYLISIYKRDLMGKILLYIIAFTYFGSILNSIWLCLKLIYIKSSNMFSKDIYLNCCSCIYQNKSLKNTVPLNRNLIWIFKSTLLMEHDFN